MNNFGRNLLVKLSILEKKHKVITYASLLLLSISTYFLRSDNEQLKIGFASLKEKNISLKKNMLIFNSNYENFPLPVWQKVKRGNQFIIQYVNPKYVKLFGHDFNYDEFEIMGKNNFQLFPISIAQIYYENDVAVSVLGSKLESIERFKDKSGKSLDLKVVKWRDIKDNKDTMVYGMVKEIIPINK
uniref:PAS domain-containing protein n=1 Tax=uncultured Polaribacter sp. TaxID=174711 RepID=UPI00260B7A98|nr:PAS domain-containing protein [uncultured Polaribacter sp.]